MAKVAARDSACAVRLEESPLQRELLCKECKTFST